MMSVSTAKYDEATIDLMMNKYCYKCAYRCTKVNRIEIENHIAKQLKENLIEES